MVDLGMLPGCSDGWPCAVNSSGEVVGWCNSGSGSYGFLYNNGTMTDLGMLVALSGWDFTAPEGINDAGQIAGWGRI